MNWKGGGAGKGNLRSLASLRTVEGKGPNADMLSPEVADFAKPTEATGRSNPACEELHKDVDNEEIKRMAIAKQQEQQQVVNGVEIEEVKRSQGNTHSEIMPVAAIKDTNFLGQTPTMRNKAKCDIKKEVSEAVVNCIDTNFFCCQIVSSLINTETFTCVYTHIETSWLFCWNRKMNRRFIIAPR